ncbi:MAG: hypothetical protein IKI20_04025 [Lachnospiraceae bacterium]|nr:hypothetical protein [Lachnospiraceae bacterium]
MLTVYSGISEHSSNSQNTSEYLRLTGAIVTDIHGQKWYGVYNDFLVVFPKKTGWVKAPMVYMPESYFTEERLSREDREWLKKKNRRVILVDSKYISAYNLDYVDYADYEIKDYYWRSDSWKGTVYITGEKRKINGKEYAGFRSGWRRGSVYYTLEENLVKP